MSSVVLPFPALLRRYRDLKDRPSELRLIEARTVTAEELALEFQASVAAHEMLPPIEEPFFPANPDRDGPKSAKAKRRTFGWAMAIKATVPGVVVSEAPELGFCYVEREIIPTRTSHRPTYEPGVVDGRQVQIDLILAHVPSGRPIIAELKVVNDKDPYTALVQALAGASQLVSGPQRMRLATHLCALAHPDREPTIDVYVLLADFPPSGRPRYAQLSYATRLAKDLEGLVEMKRYIGRIRILSLSMASETSVVATTKLPSRD